MWRGWVAAIGLLATSGCDKLADPVSTAIFFGATPNAASADVRAHLPSAGADALRRLGEFGYVSDVELARAADHRASASAELSIHDAYYVPVVRRPDQATERLYLLKSFIDQHGSGEGYGVIIDLDESGHISTAVGFKAYAFIF